jgi:hypothetical protein
MKPETSSSKLYMLDMNSLETAASSDAAKYPLWLDPMQPHEELLKELCNPSLFICSRQTTRSPNVRRPNFFTNHMSTSKVPNLTSCEQYWPNIAVIDDDRRNEWEEESNVSSQTMLVSSIQWITQTIHGTGPPSPHIGQATRVEDLHTLDKLREFQTSSYLIIGEFYVQKSMHNTQPACTCTYIHTHTYTITDTDTWVHT